MYGETAGLVVRELVKSKLIPPYHDEQLRRVAQELRGLDELAGDRRSPPDALLYTRAIQHNKRCILAYLLERVHRLEELWWIAGSARTVSRELSSCLSSNEVGFLNRYDAIVGDYISSTDVDLNLVNDLILVLRIEVCS
jgi:GINS complex subunit 1